MVAHDSGADLMLREALSIERDIAEFEKTSQALIHEADAISRRLQELHVRPPAIIKVAKAIQHRAELLAKELVQKERELDQRERTIQQREKDLHEAENARIQRAVQERSRAVAQKTPILKREVTYTADISHPVTGSAVMKTVTSDTVSDDVHTVTPLQETPRTPGRAHHEEGSHFEADLSVPPELLEIHPADTAAKVSKTGASEDEEVEFIVTIK